MKESLGTFFVKHIVAGVVTFLPFGALLFLLFKAYELIHSFGRKIAGVSEDHDGTLLLITILVILFMVTFFFFFGWFILPRTKRKASNWVENNILSFIPGYQVLKGMATGVLSNSDQLRPALLERIPGIQELGLVIEALPDNRFAVYIPEVPDFNRGRVLVVQSEMLEFLDGKYLKLKEVVERYGYGAGELIERKDLAV